MKLTKCFFSQPITERSRAGIHQEMLNQDVTFLMKVNVKVTDPKDVTKMLELFNKAASDFKKVWGAKAKKRRRA
jgi:hypothetical protein